MNRQLLGRARRVVRDAERGVSAVVLAIAMTVMMAAAALGFDIAKLYYEKQMVRNAVDAAAQYGAAQLQKVKGGTMTMSALIADVQTFASKNYDDQNHTALAANVVNVNFLCIVGNGNPPATPTAGYVSYSSTSVNAAQLGSTCNPHTYRSGNGEVNCSASSCAIKCGISNVAGWGDTDGATDVCNAIKVSVNKRVDFSFAPAIGIPNWQTGAVSTVSCSGTCGDQAAPKPLNVVVMADRTASMWGDFYGVRSDMRPTKSNGSLATGSDSNLNALKTGIKNMLDMMTPSQQYVALGTIHKSAAAGSTAPLAAGAKTLTETSTTTTVPYCSRTDWWGNCTVWSSKTVTTTTPNDVFTGTWVPIGFAKDYQNASSTLRTNVTNLNYANLTTTGTNGTTAYYYYNQLLDSDGTYSNQGTGTHLAAALKGAANYLLTSVDANNYVALDDGTRQALPVKPSNVIILETDGQPSELLNNATSDSAPALSFANGNDIGASSSVARGCTNLKKVAAQAKAAGIIIITIGYGSALSGTQCSSTETAAQALANAASTADSITGSGTADTNCDVENGDGDYYYCATSTTQLQNVFAAALGNIDSSTKFMDIPDLGN